MRVDNLKKMRVNQIFINHTNNISYNYMNNLTNNSMETKIYISPRDCRHFLYFLLSFELILVSIYFVINLIDQTPVLILGLFDLDGEFTIPSLFSAGQLFLVGIVFLSISLNKKLQGISFRVFFGVLSLGFVFLSFDEFFSVHERFFRLSKHLDDLPSFKQNHGIWIFPYLAFCALFILFSLKTIIKLRKNYKKETNMILFGVILFLFGAVGLEVFSYEFLRDENLLSSFYYIEVIFEELLEMMGISFILYSAILLRNKIYNLIV